MIYLINTWNSNTYYARDNGEIYNGSTGSVYIEDFVHEMKIEHITLNIHPNIRYSTNGCHIGMSNISLSHFKSIKDIPKWFYCYDTNKPLLKQLSEKEFEEFVSMDNEPYINYKTGEEGINRFNKDWYIEKGYR